MSKNLKHLPRRWWQAAPRARWVIVGIVLLLAALRLSLPAVVERYVNRQLNRAHDYGGRIGRVDIQLWRGRYRIHELAILKKSGDIQTPFFAAQRLDLAIEWKELFHGAVVGQVTMHEPRLNFEEGPTAAQTQTGKDESWNKMLESLFPFKLNRVEIQRGEIHFKNTNSTPPVDIYLHEVAAVATNLSNARDLKTGLPAGISARATTIGGGGLDFNLQLNPLAAAPTYQLTTQLTNVDLVALNDLLKAYGKFDVERGVFGLYTSVAAKDGNYEGYFKVFFSNLDVFAWQKERQKNVLEIFWQGVVGTVATVLKNQPKDTLAARVPVSGSYQGSKVGILTAVGSILQNAFIHALVPKVDDQITVQKVEQKLDKVEKSKTETPVPTPDEKGGQQLIKP